MLKLLLVLVLSVVLFTACSRKVVKEVAMSEPKVEEGGKPSWVNQYGMQSFDGQYLTIIGKSASFRDIRGTGLQNARKDAHNDLRDQFIEFIGQRVTQEQRRTRGYDAVRGTAESDFTHEETAYWDGIFGQLLIVDTYNEVEETRYGDRNVTIYLKGQMLQSKLEEAFQTYERNFERLRELDSK